MNRRSLLSAAVASTALGVSAPLRAQAYPSRPIRMVVPFPPGGPTDAFARLYAEALGKQLGHPVVVENKAGAGGTLGTLDVKRSAADGYTVLFGTASTHMLYNLVQPKPQYDAMADFAFIGVLGGAPMVFAVAPNMPHALMAMVAEAKAHPGKFNYGSPGTGTLGHVVAERLKQVTGAPITHVPYKGAAPALQDLMGGQIQMTVDTLGGLLQHHVGGRVHIVGVATAKRLSTAPEIPTVAESADLPQPFEATLWNVVSVPRETSSAVQRALADATGKVMNDPAVHARLESQSMFADAHVGQDAAAAFVKAESARYKPIVASLGDLTSN